LISRKSFSFHSSPILFGDHLGIVRWYQKRLGAAASAVQQQHGIIDATVGTMMRASEGAIVQVQGVQGLTVAKEEMRRRKSAFFRLCFPSICSLGSRGVRPERARRRTAIMSTCACQHHTTRDLNAFRIASAAALGQDLHFVQSSILFRLARVVSCPTTTIPHDHVPGALLDRGDGLAFFFITLNEVVVARKIQLLPQRLQAVVLEQRISKGMLLGPIGRLRRRVALIVVFAGGKGNKFPDIGVKLLGLGRKKHVFVLEGTGDGVHAHDLVHGWFVARHT